MVAACLPLSDAEAAMLELDRIAGEGAVRAMQIVAQTTGYAPDAPTSKGCSQGSRSSACRSFSTPPRALPISHPNSTLMGSRPECMR